MTDLIEAGMINQKLFYSGVLVLGLFVLRWLMIRLVRRRDHLLSDAQRRAILLIRNLMSLVLLVGLVVLWAPELEAFMFSIAAFAVAIVLATKEIIMCLGGGILRSVTGAYTVGDWIEIGPHSGEVVEIYATMTQLQEFDRVKFEHTGRLITVPNSLLLSTPVVNHSFRKRYIFHEFVITAEPMPGVMEARQAIEDGLRVKTEEFLDVAQRYRSVLERRAGIDLPGLGPEVRVRTNDICKIRFEARLFCPRDLAGDMEQVGMAAFLEWQEEQDWQFVGVVPRAAPADAPS